MDLVAFTKAIESVLYTAYAELFVFTKKPIGCHNHRGRKGRVVCCRIPEVATQKKLLQSGEIGWVKTTQLVDDDRYRFFESDY